MTVEIWTLNITKNPPVRRVKTHGRMGLKRKHLIASDPGAARTRDKLIKSQLLCQLSYGAILAKQNYTLKMRDVNSFACEFPIKPAL